MKRWCAIWLMTGIPLAAPVAGIAQQTPTPPAAGQTTQAPQNRTEPDIVVQALNETDAKAIEQARSAVPSALGYRKVAERSAMFARCIRHVQPSLLRDVVEDDVNTPSSKLALDTIIRNNVGCYTGYPAPPPAPPYFGDCNPTIADDVSFSTSNGGPSSGAVPVMMTCRAFYDRGYLLLRAIRQSLPDLSLTTQEMSDPTVHSRFDAREIPRNRYRLSEDFEYFSVAVCLVRVQPGLAGRFVHADDGDSSQIDKIGRLLLLRGRSCVGNARRVRIEPIQFRMYVADAFYRWAVAARNVSSLLLPTGDDKG